MTRFQLFALLFSSTLGALSVAAEPITIYTYNYAQVPEAQFKLAVKTAGKTLSAAGIETRWVSAEEASGAFGPSDLAMRVLPGVPEGFPKGVAGFAPLSEKTGHGSVAMVFQERIAELVRRTDPKAWNSYCPLPRSMAEALVLGHMMAHEIGHLLLGVGSHSKKGLMTYPWGPRELHALARGKLLFTTDEASRIQSYLSLADAD